MSAPGVAEGGTNSMSLLRKTPTTTVSSKAASSSSLKVSNYIRTGQQQTSSQQLAKGRVAEESMLLTKEPSDPAADNSTSPRQTQMMTETPTATTPPKKPQKLRRRVATMAQRRAANIRERRRMFNLNSAFDRLRKKVPSFAYEKRLSRIETLKLAIMYIRFMDDLVRDEAYVEKYKRLTSNYPPMASVAGVTNGHHHHQPISLSAQTGAGPFMSPYLASIYGQCDSPALSLSPDPLHQQSNLSTIKQQQQIEVNSLPDHDNSLALVNNCAVASRPPVSAGPQQQKLCTDSNCTGGLQQQHYSTISGATTPIPPVQPSAATATTAPSVRGGSVICCSSPALSSSTTCNSTASSSSSSSLNSFSESPVTSPQHQQVQHQHHQQLAIVCHTPRGYYQQQQQQHPYGNLYPLERAAAAPSSCLVYGAAERQTSKRSSEHTSKMFNSYDSYGLTATAPADQRQGQQPLSDPRYCLGGDTGSGPNPATCVRPHDAARAALTANEQPLHHHNQLGYTLHSLQAR